MGLLDDLRNQADSQRVSEEEEAGREANREQYYLDKIQPRMVKTYQFFKELADHLNYIKMETIVEYPLMPGGAPLPLRQQGYKVIIDSSKALKRIDFSMEGILEEPIEFEIFGKDAVFNHSERIRGYAFRHDYKDRKDATQYVQAAKFTLKGPLPLKVTVEADVDASEIKLTIRNFIEPGFQKHSLTVEEFNDAFLDKLGKFVLRQEPFLFGSTEELTEEAKKQIRDRMIVEQRIHQQELLEAEQRLKAEKVVKKDHSTKEQLKRAVNTRVTQGKESLKDMFSKLKKQAGFDSTSTETSQPPGPVAAKPQTPPAQPTAAVPEKQIPTSPAAVAPISTAKPIAAQPPVPAATAVPVQQTPVPPAPAEPAPPVPEAPAAAEIKKTQAPPRVYTAPGPNPFLTGKEPEIPDSEPEQINNSAEAKPGSGPAGVSASSPKPVLTPEELERDLANIMERDTPENAQEEADPAPREEETPDIDLSAPSPQPSPRLENDLEEKPAPVPTASEAPDIDAPALSIPPQIDKSPKKNHS